MQKGVGTRSHPTTPLLACHCHLTFWYLVFFNLLFLRFSGCFRCFIWYEHPRRSEIHYHFLTFFRVLASGPLQLSFAPRFKPLVPPLHNFYEVLKAVVPNRGAICNTQGCRELIRFLLYHWKDIFKMSPKINPNCYGFATRCRKLYFCFVGCRKPKKVGNHCLKGCLANKKVASLLLVRKNDTKLTPVWRNTKAAMSQNNWWEEFSVRFIAARILWNSGIATTANNCGCEFRPRQFRSVSAEPRLKNTDLLQKCN